MCISNKVSGGNITSVEDTFLSGSVLKVFLVVAVVIIIFVAVGINPLSQLSSV